MPTYEYRCENGHNFEVMQRMSDDPVQTCEVCGASVQRVFHPIAVHFKGSGFYNTDYGTKKRAREKEASAAKDSSAKDSGSKDSGGESKPSTDSGGETKKSETSTTSAPAPKADAA